MFFRALNDIGHGASSRVHIPRSGWMIHANIRGVCMRIQLHPRETVLNALFTSNVVICVRRQPRRLYRIHDLSALGLSLV
jgi:hypothetical protein